MNNIPAFLAHGMIMNWMEDSGWLQRIGWDINEIPPGAGKVNAPIAMPMRVILLYVGVISSTSTRMRAGILLI